MNNPGRMRFAAALLAAAAFFAPGTTHAQKTGLKPSGFLDGATRVKVLDEFVGPLSTNGALALGSVDVVRTKPGRCWLVVVGTKDNKALEKRSAKLVLKTRKLARLEAEKQLALFFNAEVTSDTRLRTTTVKETVRDEAGVISRRKKVKKVLTEMTRETAQERLRGGRVVGTWYTEDEMFFHLAMAFDVRCRP